MAGSSAPLRTIGEAPVPRFETAEIIPVWSRFVCEVCYNSVARSEMRGCSQCPHRYCRDCLGTYWHTAIFSGSHGRLLCMCGGCTVAATDEDIKAVVPPRTFTKLRYFRSRDEHQEDPHVRWCPRDGCWHEITVLPPANSTCVVCPDCATKVCYKCGEEQVESHVCPQMSSTAATVDTCSFHLWATFHTKTCPSCHARIQRNHGCSHMTCSRCSAYFCWRCKGFLHSGTPSAGRPCVCDRIVGTALYSGLIVVGIIGLPIIVTVCAIGSGPYLVYCYARRRATRAPGHRSNVLGPSDVGDAAPCNDSGRRNTLSVATVDSGSGPPAGEAEPPGRSRRPRPSQLLLRNGAGDLARPRSERGPLRFGR